MASTSRDKEIVSSEEIDKDEIVHSEETNTSRECVVFRELIFFHWTNINYLRIKEESPELVQRLETIITSKDSGKIARYISENPVFVVPVLRVLEGTNRSHSYKVVKDLMELGVVKRWPFKLDHPTPGTRGPKPHIHSLIDVELEGREDPKILEAQKVYYGTHERFDPIHAENKSIESGLNKISLEVVDYFKGRGRTGKSKPPPFDVALYLRENYPDLSGSQIADFARKISHSLYKEAEA